MRTLSDIARSLERAVLYGDAGTVIDGVQHDSRAVKPGDLFAVLKGENTDGKLFVSDAEKKGASALLVEERLESELPQIVVNDVRQALGHAAATLYDYPTKHMATVGITGTNGKTTTVYLVERALKKLGLDPGIMSTVTYRFKDKEWQATHTTPESSIIQSVARKMSSAGATHLVMEASSHGLVLHRLNGCAFRVVAFTNLTQDHLDFHKDMEEYAAAKLLLFTDAIKETPDTCAVVNLDDAFSLRIIENLKHPVTRVSIDPGSDAEIRPTGMPNCDIHGIETDIQTPEGVFHISSPLIGPHNLSNLLLALGICASLGVSYGDACSALTSFGAPGRLERVTTDQSFTVLVDYAHTPDALHRMLTFLHPLTTGRLICVFGCGGDRDNAKRPLMGKAVKDGADVAIVTSDNPRTEDPQGIIDMILPGVHDETMPLITAEQIKTVNRGYWVEPDRRKAIALALMSAGPGDTVLIAGKGHEDYQILGKTKIHFDDREEARAVLMSLEPK